MVFVKALKEQRYFHQRDAWSNWKYLRAKSPYAVVSFEACGTPRAVVSMRQTEALASVIFFVFSFF